MVVTRKVSADGRVALGSLPGSGRGHERLRRFSVGTDRAGREATVRFDQDRVVVIVGGVVVRSLGAADLQLTPGEFAGLNGVSNTTDQLPAARVDLDRPMVVSRKVSPVGIVVLGSLPGNGSGRGGQRRFPLGRALTGRQVTVGFVQGQEVAQDRVVVIVDGVVVKSRGAADLQLTRGEFAELNGVSNTIDSLPVVQAFPAGPVGPVDVVVAGPQQAGPGLGDVVGGVLSPVLVGDGLSTRWPLVGSVVSGDQQDVAGTSAGVDRVVQGSSEGSPIRRAVGEMTAFLFTDTEDHDVDAGDAGAAWFMDPPLPEAQGGGPTIWEILAGKGVAERQPSTSAPPRIRPPGRHRLP